jgi:hypothetical protein
MAVDVAALVGGALGGAIAGSVLQPIFAQRGARRDVRAAALRAISEVERTRWYPRKETEFRSAVVACRTAALVAGLDRGVTDQYVRQAQICRHLSQANGELFGEEGGGIPAELSDLARQTAELLVSELWHPYRSRPGRRRNLRNLAERESHVLEDLGDDDKAWLRNWTPPTL